MDDSQQRSLAEALILAATEPIPAPRIASVIPGCTPARARSLVEALNADYEEQGRGFEIREVAGGYQLRTRPEFAEFVRHLAPARPLRLSQAALETLAVVAYRQPATRAEVEFVRGVDAGVLSLDCACRLILPHLQPAGFAPGRKRYLPGFWPILVSAW